MTYNLAMVYKCFSKALSDQQPDDLGDFICSKHMREGRFDIHITNREETLTAALKEIFPVVWRLVGDEFFGFMARTYIAKQPPKKPQLLLWAREFPAFLKAFPAASSLPYLADVAQLEITRKWLYLRPEGLAFDPGQLQSLTPDQQTHSRFKFRPTVALIKSPYPIGQIVEQHLTLSDDDIDINLEDGPDYLLLARQEQQIITYALSQADYAFYEELADGKTITKAYEAVVMGQPDFDMGQALAKAFQQQLFEGDGKSMKE